MQTLTIGTTDIAESAMVDKTETKCLNASLAAVACSYSETNDRYEDSGGTEVALIMRKEIAVNFSGYYITLEGSTNASDSDSEGEKAVNASLTVAGKVYFGMNQSDIPAAGSCTANLGIARGYKVDIFNGTATRNIFAGGGMPPSPIAGLVTMDGQTVPFLIRGKGPSAFDPSVPELDFSGGRQRTYWYYR